MLIREPSFSCDSTAFARALALALICAAILLGAAPAWAHSVNVFASVDGHTIRGKAYFKGGAPAQDVTVKMLDANRQPLGETKTDAEGKFAFEAKVRCDHIVLVDAGEGHGAQTTVATERLPADLPSLGPTSPSDATTSPRTKPDSSAVTKPTSVDATQLDALRAEIAHLGEQIARQEDQTRFRDLAGGIGYIIGLAGLGYLISARLKRKPS